MQREAPGTPKGSAKILLADDSPNIHKAVALGLRKEAFEIIYCDNGQDALRILRDSKPELALLDLDMPGPNGAELVQIIRRDPQMATCKVVLLCSSFDQIDEAHLDSLPADGRIWKPFEAHVLLSLIKKVLSSPPAQSAVRVSHDQTSALPPTPPAREKKASQKTQDLSDDLIRDLTAETFKGAEAPSNTTPIESTTAEDTLVGDVLSSTNDDILDRLSQSPEVRESQESTWALASADVNLTEDATKDFAMDPSKVAEPVVPGDREETEFLWGESAVETTGVTPLYSASETISTKISFPSLDDDDTRALPAISEVEKEVLSGIHLSPLKNATATSGTAVSAPGISEEQLRKLIRSEIENAFASWFKSQLENKLYSVIQDIERET